MSGRYCADCQHLSREHGIATCALPTIDLVTGTEQPLGLPAGDERSWRNARPGGCGPAGNNWKAIEK